MRTKHMEEKVGVAKIRIRQQRSCTMAVLGSFVAADKLLKSWAAALQPSAECDFEIEYLDGYTVTGRYPMRQKCTTRQSLGAYVKRAIENVAAGAQPGAMAGMELAGFLDRYEMEDFAERDGRRRMA